MRKSAMLGLTLVTCLSWTSRVSAAIVTVYTDKTAWENALAGQFLTEDFNDSQLNDGVSFASTESGHVNPAEGYYQDVLASTSQNAPMTTWSFTPKTAGFGGDWTLGGPGGSGNSLLVYLADSSLYVGAIPNSYGGEFWGFVSDTPFTSVELIGGGGTNQQNYRLDNMVYSQVSEHATITEYVGPATCVACHEVEAQAMFGSVHYQQTGPTPNVPNIPGVAGERGYGDIGFNTYCGTHVSSSRATCAGCHVGNGRFPSPVMTQDQLSNIDCMMCHQDQYKRKPAGPFQMVEVVGSDGQPAFIQVPVEDETGFAYVPDEAAMSISILEAAQTVHRTTRASCLRCHAGASGSDGGKRGDLSSVTVSPPLSSDIHMSPMGADLTCQTCHQFEQHRVRGRGLDLRPNDRPERFTCASCHGPQPHGDYSANDGRKRDTHAMRVACQSCHIPTFAKDVSTEMARDWNQPVYSPAACSGQGGWKPEETRQSNVIPTYAWFDGTSEVYVLGQVPTLLASGEAALGVPLGGVNSQGAMLYPMKEHRSTSAQLASVTGDVDMDEDVDLDDLMLLAWYLTGPNQTPGSIGWEAADLDGDLDVDLADVDVFANCFAGGCGTVGEIIPHSTFTFFTTGDFAQAVEAGMSYAGMRGTWQQVNVHTYQTINHGVEGAPLNCGACHASLGGGPARMDLQGELGYQLKDALDTVCTQCHELQAFNGFAEVHAKHVEDQRYDCSWCHQFTRPSRGLTTP